MKPKRMLPSHARPPRNPSKNNSQNGQFVFTAGAGWRNQTAESVKEWPYAFKTLADLLLYFEITLEATGGTPLSLYSLNGVPSSLAISPGSDTYNCCMLYMAPSQAAQCWYYLLNTFGWTPPLGAGPVISAGQARGLGVSYVAISDSGTAGSPTMFSLSLGLDLSKVTLIG